MSNTIDTRVVEMEFRNQQFERNAAKTQETIKKLEDSLDFKSDISKSLDIVSSKFTTMGIVGQRVLSNLTDSAYKFGTSLVKSLTTDQITAGFSEYELKMGSIQTIMNGTGESLEVVSSKLDELNEYADKTIYSFSDMTSNIGKFTNAGVKLDSAVGAIQGVANLAAVSGANAQMASHAMYNFAQALSAGYVKLIDWKSIENANMATIEFKNELIKTALEIGTIRKEGDKYVTTTTDLNNKISDAFDATMAFNDSLSHQWLTTDVLTKTLGRYSDETTDIGKKAFKAATEVKTFTQMMDALKESAGSGWATSMELIFGNYEEALKLWTHLFERIDGWVSAFSDKRNNILKAWSGFGGRDEMVSALDNVLTALESMTKPMSRALDKLFEYNKGWRVLADLEDTVDLGPVSNVIYESMVKASRGWNKFTESLIPSEKTLRSITDILSGFFAIIRDVISIVAPIVGFVGKIIKIASPLLKILLAIGGVIGNTILKISNAIRSSLNLGPTAKNVGEFLDNIYDKVNNFADKAVDKIYEIPDLVANILDNLRNLELPDFAVIGRGLVEGLTNAINNFREKRTLNSFFEGFFNTESVKKAGDAIKRLFENIIKNTNGFVDKIRETLLKMGPIGKFIVSLFDLVTESISHVITSIKSLLPSLNNTMGNATSKLSQFLDEMTIKDVVSILGVVRFVMAMNQLRKGLKSVSDIAEEAKKFLSSATRSIATFGKAVRDVGRGVKLNLQAEAFKNIAFAMGTIVASIAVMASIDPAALDNAVKDFVKIAVTMAALVMVVSTLKTESLKAKNTGADMTRYLGKAINTMARGFAASAVMGSISLVIGSISALIVALTVSLAALSSMDYDSLQNGIKIIGDVLTRVGGLVAAIGGVMVVLSLIDKIPSKSKTSSNIIKIAGSITLLAMGLTALAAPIAIFAAIKTETFSKGLFAVTQVLQTLGIAFASLAILSRIAPDMAKNLAAISLVLFTFSVSLTAMIAPIFLLGSMKITTLNKGLTALGRILLSLSGAFIGLGIAMKIMGKTKAHVFKMASAMGLLTASVSILALMAPTIIANADKVKQAIKVLVDATVDAIVDSTDKIVDGALDLIDKVLDSIIKYLPEILNEIGVIIIQVFNWLIDFLPPLTDKLGKALGLLISGIADAIKENVKFGDFLITFGAIAGVILIIKKLASLKDDVKNAIPAFILIAGVVSMIGIIISAILANTNGSGADVLKTAQGLSTVLLAMIPLARSLPMIAKSMKNIKVSQIAKTFGSLSAVMVILGTLFIKMDETNIDPVKMIQYSTALSLSMRSMAPLIQSIGKAVESASNAKGFAAFGGTLLIIAGVIATLGAAFWALEKLEVDPIKMAEYAIGLSIAFLGISPMILSIAAVQKQSAGMRKSQFKSLLGVLVAVGGITTILGGIFAGLSVLNINPINMTKYASALSIAMVGISPAILAIAVVQKASSGLRSQSLKPMVGILISVSGIAVAVGGIFAGLGALNIDPNATVRYSEALSLSMVSIVPLVAAMGAIMAIFKKTGLTNFTAIVKIGTAILTVTTIAIAIFAAVSALLGAINEWSGGGFVSLIESGTEVLVSLAEGVASFIGTLLGGTLGASLGEFAKLAEPFFTTMSNIPDNFGDKVTAMGAGIVALTAAGLLNAIGDLLDFLTGKGSLADLGKDLADFAPYMSDFVNDFPNVSVEKTENIKRASEAIKALMTSIPKEGGLWQLITGTTNMNKFSTGITAVGKALVEFDQITNGNLDSESIQAAAKCGKILSELNNALPSTGGWLQAIAGEKDMNKFANGIYLLADALVDFSDLVAPGGTLKINESAVKAAANAGSMLMELNAGLPDTGGFWQKIAGEKDLGKFADNVSALGRGIASFFTAVSNANMDASVVSQAVWVAQSIAKLNSFLPSDYSAVNWVTGLPSLNAFSISLPALGSAIKLFAESTQGPDYSVVSPALNAIIAMSNVAKTLNENILVFAEFGNDKETILTTFRDILPTFASSITKFSDNLSGMNLTRVKTAVSAIEAIIDAVRLANNLGGFSLETFQKAIENVDLTKVEETAMRTWEDPTLGGIAEKFKVIGQGLIQNLYFGMLGYDEDSMNIRKKIIDEIANVLYSFVDPSNANYLDAIGAFKSLGVNIVNGLSDGFSDPWAISKLESVAKATIDKAFEAMEIAADSHSPSRRAMTLGGNIDEGFGIGLEKNSSIATKSANLITKKAFDALNDGMSRIYLLMSSGVEFEPTIAPVLDLTSARKSAAELNTLFSAAKTSAMLNSGMNYTLGITKSVKMEVDNPVKPADLTKVTDGINKLGQKLTDMEKAISDMQLYLDTGALVGGITMPMMKSINTQQKRIARGVIPSKLK